ncbi:MAG: hypothetical protein JW814_12230 [Candidatus Krumholzibacteriota bacterium]|nr:hypothetical protein [Candidatus Krumholzibacteriota bacterium]
MKTILAIYNAFLPLALALSRPVALFNNKTARTIEARKGIKKRWLEKSAKVDRKRPLIWIHVSSVGEFLQIRPILDILESGPEPACQVALTFYSPSGYEYYNKSDRAAKNRSIIFTDYLPFDTLGNAMFCLDLLRPDLVIYVKYDLWPNLVAESSRRKIPQLLLSVDFASREKNLSGIRGMLYRGLFSMMKAITSVSSTDAVLLKARLGSDVKIVTTGDIRFDQVVSRIENSKVSLPEFLTVPRSRYIIAGSTWPKDEELVISAFSRLLDEFDDIRLIIAPHETDETRLKEVEETLERQAVSHQRLSGSIPDAEPLARAIIVDGLGFLAELYGAGVIAYVGGSWTTGVHNILEPAVWGLPVFFGPRIGNAWEAGRLIELGAAFIVTDTDDLSSRIASMLREPDRMEEAGKRAETYIRNNTGASSRCSELIRGFIQDR